MTFFGQRLESEFVTVVAWNLMNVVNGDHVTSKFISVLSMYGETYFLFFIFFPGVDLRSSKVCELGMFNHKSNYVFYPFEKSKFRCRYDYYWASVFKVYYPPPKLYMFLLFRISFCFWFGTDSVGIVYFMN